MVEILVLGPNVWFPNLTEVVLTFSLAGSVAATNSDMEWRTLRPAAALILPYKQKEIG
jgi:hypothetical protein